MGNRYKKKKKHKKWRKKQFFRNLLRLPGNAWSLNLTDIPDYILSNMDMDLVWTRLVYHVNNECNTLKANSFAAWFYLAHFVGVQVIFI